MPLAMNASEQSNARASSDYAIGGGAHKTGTHLARALPGGYIESEAYCQGVSMPMFGAPDVPRLEAKGNIKGLVHALAYKDAGIRCAAAQALGRLHASEATAPLIRAMLDSDDAVAVMAAQALGEIADPSSVEALTLMLSNASQARRVAALRALGHIGSDAALDGVVAVLRLEHGDLDEQATLALADAGPGQIPRLLNMLESDEPRITDAACKALCLMGNVAVEALTAQAQSRAEAEATRAITALSTMRSPAALGALVQMLIGSDYTLRPKAEAVLVTVGDAAVPALVSALQQGNVNTQRAIIKALGAIHTQEAAMALASVASAGPKPVARAALQALAEAPTEEAAPALLAALSDSDWLTRQHAAEGLGKLQPAAERDAALCKALFDDMSPVRKAAEGALQAHNWQPTNDDERTAQFVARQDWHALSELKQGAIPALTRLIPLLLATDRIQAVACLAASGSQALEPLLTLLGHSDVNTRTAAAEGLGKLGDPGAVPALIRVLETDPGAVGSAAASALGALHATAAIGALEKAVSSGSGPVRLPAASALAKMGADGEPILLALSHSDKSHVVQAAIEGLAQLRSPAATERIVDLVSDERQDVQRDAIRAAVGLGAAIIPLADKRLRQGDTRTRALMADLLGHIGDRQAEAPLLRALWHSDEQTSLAAAQALELLGVPSLDARFEPARVESVYALTLARTPLSADERQWLEAEALGDLAKANPVLDRLHARLAADQDRLVSGMAIVGSFGHNLTSMVATFKSWLLARKVAITAWDGWFYYRAITIEGERPTQTVVLLFYRPRP